MHPEPSAPPPDIEAALATVRAIIAAACARANRPVESVTLIAVSKTHPADLIIQAARVGVTDFGENRVEESAKIAEVNAACPGLTWHMIGHVQSRKAADVIPLYNPIHSVDSVKIAERYSRFAGELKLTIDVLLEINVSGEASKEGLSADRWARDPAQRAMLWDAVRQIVALPHLRVRGLMTVAPIVPDMEATRPIFAALPILKNALASDFPDQPWDTLSMGMTDDYPVAIEEGATMIRVGRAIFGSRQPAP